MLYFPVPPSTSTQSQNIPAHPQPLPHSTLITVKTRLKVLPSLLVCVSPSTHKEAVSITKRKVRLTLAKVSLSYKLNPARRASGNYRFAIQKKTLFLKLLTATGKLLPHKSPKFRFDPERIYRALQLYGRLESCL